MTSPAVVNLGTCWGTPNGQDLSSPSYMATGQQCVAEAVLRRWTTTQRQLIDDPDYGYNITDLVSSNLTPSQIAYAQQRAAVEAQKDERVLSATVVMTFSAAGVLSVAATLTTAAGPFQLVLSVSAVTGLAISVQP